MALVPQFYDASTKAIAEKSLELGHFRYPGICYIIDEHILGWFTQDNRIEYIGGDKQITDIRYDNGILSFYSGTEKIFSANTAMSPETEAEIIRKITESLNLSEYAKTNDVIRLLDDKVGDLGEKNTVVDYINSLSYDGLVDLPIKNLLGTLTNIIDVSKLNNGVYKIKGQYIIGGECTTIQISHDDVFFIVSHSDDGLLASITLISGNTIRLYFVNSDGSFTTDMYITESWVRSQDFITSANVKDYVRDIISGTVTEVIDAVLDVRLDAALDKRIGEIASDDINQLFITN